MPAILAKATGAGNSSDFGVTHRPVTVKIYPSANLLSDEYANVVEKNPDDTYDPVFDDNGQVQLSSTKPRVTIVGGGIYRVEMAARTSATGAEIKAGPGGR